MVNLSETPSWAGVYQIEQADPVLGGTPTVGAPSKAGLSNWSTQQLSNRTAYLKQTDDMVIAAIMAAGITVDRAVAGQLWAAVNALADARVAQAVPAGMVMLWDSAAAPPIGWLKLNGAAVLRANYAALDAAVYCGDSQNATAEYYYRATTNVNPSANRSTTGAYLVLKDTRARFVRGLDEGLGLDAARSRWAYQADEVKSHTHTVTGAAGAGTSVGGANTVQQSGGTSPTSATGGTETRPINVTSTYVIRY
jgi:hypothetical protein